MRTDSQLLVPGGDSGRQPGSARRNFHYETCTREYGAHCQLWQQLLPAEEDSTDVESLPLLSELYELDSDNLEMSTDDQVATMCPNERAVVATVRIHFVSRRLANQVHYRMFAGCATSPSISHLLPSPARSLRLRTS